MLPVITEVLRTVIVPIIIGLSSIYFVNRFEREKMLSSEKKERQKEFSILETQYYLLTSRYNNLSLKELEKDFDINLCYIDIVAIKKIIDEVNMIILPNEQKQVCGYLRHSLELREIELKALLDDKSRQFIEKDILQLEGTLIILGDKFLKPIKKFLDTEYKK